MTAGFPLVVDMTAPYAHLYQTEECHSWHGITDFFYKTLRPAPHTWLFRGQSDSKWLLASTLERAATRLGFTGDDIRHKEDGILREFKRQSHHYYTDLPKDKEFIEWLSLMQHHGAPTRLLDWTYSFFIAVFFALETLKVGCPAAVWAIHNDWLRRAAESCLPEEARHKLTNDRFAKDPTTVDAIIRRHPPISLVFPLNPFRLNRRQVLQQGRFLVPGNVTKPFMENLQRVIVNTDSQSSFIKLEIRCDTHSALREMIGGLHAMNINRATLFPDLDGFSGSLRNRMAMKLAVEPDATFSRRD